MGFRPMLCPLAPLWLSSVWGAGSILKAFDGRHPWQALKALGSGHDRPFLRVQHDELERRVASRDHDKKKPIKKGKKADRVPASRIVALSPDQAKVHPSAFCDENENALSAVGRRLFTHGERCLCGFFGASPAFPDGQQKAFGGLFSPCHCSGALFTS